MSVSFNAIPRSCCASALLQFHWPPNFDRRLWLFSLWIEDLLGPDLVKLGALDQPGIKRTLTFISARSSGSFTVRALCSKLAYSWPLIHTLSILTLPGGRM